jgi:hypothetical protein
MRRAVLAGLVALAGCPGPNNPSECTTDGDCGSDVCARDGECLPAADVYKVKVTWTIHGMAASATTCAPAPDFYINFYTRSQETFGFAPVPCNQGQFFVDKLPTRFIDVELGADNRFDQFASFDAQGTATFDLSL